MLLSQRLTSAAAHKSGSRQSLSEMDRALARHTLHPARCALPARHRPETPPNPSLHPSTSKVRWFGYNHNHDIVTTRHNTMPRSPDVGPDPDAYPLLSRGAALSSPATAGSSRRASPSPSRSSRPASRPGSRPSAAATSRSTSPAPLPPRYHLDVEAGTSAPSSARASPRLQNTSIRTYFIASRSSRCFPPCPCAQPACRQAQPDTRSLATTLTTTYCCAGHSLLFVSLLSVQSPRRRRGYLARPRPRRRALGGSSPAARSRPPHR